MSKYQTKWQIAYAAKRLRQEGTVTISCTSTETPSILEMLKSFSHSNPILNRIVPKPNSQEVLLEIVNP